MRVRNPRELILPALLALAVVGVLVYVTLSLASLRHELDQSNDERTDLRSELISQESASEALARQVKELGGRPVVDPDEADEEIEAPDPDDSTEEISKGDVALAVAAFCQDTRRCKGDDGENATPAQVAAAVATYCDAKGDCRGRPGEDARPPSQDMVLGAVQAYCAEHGCKGDPGRDGIDGTDGEDGAPGRPPTPEEIAAQVIAYCSARNECQGPPGPPPTAEQIRAQVQAYCAAHNECRGRDGTDGQAGKPGRGIASVDCLASGEWQISYTDGTSSTTPGPCRIEQTPLEESRRW